MFLRLRFALRELDAATLAAPAGVDLGFDDGDGPAELVVGRADLLRRVAEDAPRHRNPVLFEEHFGLVLVDLHAAAHGTAAGLPEPTNRAFEAAELPQKHRSTEPRGKLPRSVLCFLCFCGEESERAVTPVYWMPDCSEYFSRSSFQFRLAFSVIRGRSASRRL